MKHLGLFFLIFALFKAIAAPVGVGTANPQAEVAVDEFVQQAMARIDAQQAARDPKNPDEPRLKLFKTQLAQYTQSLGFNEFGHYSVYKENEQHQTRNFEMPEFYSLLDLAVRNPWFLTSTDKVDVLRMWMNTGTDRGRLFIVKRLIKNIDPQGDRFFIAEFNLPIRYRVYQGATTVILLEPENLEIRFRQGTHLEGGGSSAGRR